MAHIERMKKDIYLMLAAKCHVGTMALTHGMKRYVSTRSAEGGYFFNPQKTWEKIQVAARIIVAIENPADVMAIAMRPYGNRAVLKFAYHIGCHAVAGRWTPGTLTNQITQKFMEPRLLIVTDPRTDHRAVKESYYSNIPVIALCDTDSNLQNVDVVIPCNNRCIESIALMYWMLAREVLYLRNLIDSHDAWDVKPDLFFYRDPDQFLKPEGKDQEALEAPHGSGFPAQETEWPRGTEVEEWGTVTAAPFEAPSTDNWSNAPAAGDWGAETRQGEVKAVW